MPKGLKLTLGNAPNTWHTVEGLPGFFHPQIIVPVDEPGFVPAGAAKQHHQDDGCPVALVNATQKDLDAGRETLTDLRRQVKAALRDQQGVAPIEQFTAEVDAISNNEE